MNWRLSRPHAWRLTTATLTFLLLLTGGCMSPEERVHYDHLEKLQRAYDRGEMSDEEYRRAAHEVDYLRPP